MELKQRNQLQISGNQPALHVNAVAPQRLFRNQNQSKIFQTSARQTNHLCRNCGLTWSATHKDKCIAKGKICKNGGLPNHFSRICQKPKSVCASSQQSRPNVNSIDEDTTDKSVNSIKKKQTITLKADWIMRAQMTTWWLA